MAKNTSRTKVRFITGLFILATLIFSLITIQGLWKINQYGKNFQSVSDAPGLCYDEQKTDDNSVIRENSYLCYTYPDNSGKFAEVNDDDDRAIFLFDRMTLIATTQTMQLRVVTVTISSIMSVASLLGTVIYFCHNRA